MGVQHVAGAPCQHLDRPDDHPNSLGVPPGRKKGAATC